MSQPTHIKDLVPDPENRRARTDTYRVLACEYCRASIQGHLRRGQRFCSRRCAGQAGRPAQITRSCAGCSQAFTRPASWGAMAFCSRSCALRVRHASRPAAPPRVSRPCRCGAGKPAGHRRSECLDCSRTRRQQWERTRVITAEQLERKRLRARIHALNRRSVLVSAGHGIRHGVENIRRLFQEQRGCCAYCHQPLVKYHIDHVVPLARGGVHLPENWCLSCPDCNYRKHARTPQEWAADGYGRHRAS